MPKADTTTDGGSNSLCDDKMVTNMYMTGFVSLLDDTHRENPCLLMFVGAWKVDTYGKFMLAVLGAMIAGAGSEGILRLRVLLDNHLSSRAGAPVAVRLVPEGSSSQIALYFIHRTAGYLAMLLAMTFQLEIFIAVLFWPGSGLCSV